MISTGLLISKSKPILAIFAVVLVLCLTCVTAFAQQSLDWTEEGDYTLTIGANNDAVAEVTGGCTISMEVTATTGNNRVMLQYSEDGTEYVQVAAFNSGNVMAVGNEISYVVPNDGYVKVTYMENGYGGNASFSVSVEEPKPLGGVLGMVDDFTSTFVALGTSLAAWIMAPGNGIVLIGVGLFILVAIVAGIKRLLAGV